MTLMKLLAASDNVWAMQPSAFSAFCAMLEADAKTFFADAEESAPYRLENSVAVIPVDGPILRRQFWGFGAGLMETGSALEKALADPQARAILFSFCSPGGQARGVKELADAIREASSVKPCAAFADGLCCSAAYWLAAATGRIFAGPSAEVGSIGVILRHMDKSGMNKIDGLNFTYITAGSHKAVGNPDSPLSERDQAVLQGRVDAIYEMFCADVAQNMGLAPEKRDAWADGRDFLAGEAETLGLVTELVPSRQAAITKLLKETFMDRTELAQKHPELLASIEADAKQAAQGEFDARKDEACRAAVENTLSLMEIVCGSETAAKVRALAATGMSPDQLRAAQAAFGAPAPAAQNPHGEILAALKQATPAAVSQDQTPENDAAAFIRRVGAM